MVFTCATKAHSLQGASLMQSQICFMAFLQATVYFKTPTQHPGKNNSVKQFLQQKCMERLDPPPVSCFRSARVSPAKSKNLLPSVDIWVLFRLFPQPCSHSPYIGKTAPTKPPWSQWQPFPFFSLLPSKAACTVFSLFILCCWMPVL